VPKIGLFIVLNLHQFDAGPVRLSLQLPTCLEQCNLIHLSTLGANVIKRFTIVIYECPNMLVFGYTRKHNGRLEGVWDQNFSPIVKMFH